MAPHVPQCSVVFCRRAYVGFAGEAGAWRVSLGVASALYIPAGLLFGLAAWLSVPARDIRQGEVASTLAAAAAVEEGTAGSEEVAAGAAAVEEETAGSEQAVAAAAAL
jgi:hypothetical protein